MLRQPFKLAYSQYVYCHGVLHRERYPALDVWLRNFGRTPARTSFHCYDPTNIQTRFTGALGYRNNQAFGPLDPKGVSVERSKAQLESNFSFVGIVDAYKESLCLFRATATRDVPPSSCACGGKSKHPGKLNKITHGTPQHSLSELEEGQLRKLGRMIELDVLLYCHALYLFEIRIRHVEARTGVRIGCASKIEALWADVLGYACALTSGRQRLIQSLRRYGKPGCPPTAPASTYVNISRPPGLHASSTTKSKKVTHAQASDRPLLNI